jgi:hypothetical protein
MTSQRSTSANTFERLLQLEANAKAAKITEAMGMFPWDRERAVRVRISTQAELFALLDSLTPDQKTAYSEYRR